MPSDDEEIKIPSQDNAGIRKVDVRNEQLENTQGEDWLLPTESRHGARPRQTGANTLRKWKIQKIWKRTFSHP